MSVVSKLGAITALGLALSVSTAHAATLGLTTSGPVLSGTAEALNTGFDVSVFGTLGGDGFVLGYDPNGILPNAFAFDLGSPADLVGYGFTATTIEVQLGAFDSYTNGALLTFDTSALGFVGDPADSISTFPGASGVGVTLQGLAGTTPVPLPAGMLLLGTALAGLGFARKRRTA